MTIRTRIFLVYLLLVGGGLYYMVNWILDGVRPRYLRITDIDEAGKLLHDDVKSIPASVAEPYLLQQDDIVIARTGNTVGKAYIHDTGNGPLAFAGYLVRFRIDASKADPRFVIQFLHSPNYYAWVQRTLRTGAQPNINAAEYKRMPLPAFTPREQRRIAEILSTLDEAIERTEGLIGKLQQIKAGLMHDLFTRGVTPAGHLRPPRDQAPHLYKHSPLGWIPNEWEAEQLGDILRKCGGYLQTGPFGSQLHSHEYEVEGVPVVMPQDINGSAIETQQIARISEQRAGDLARHRMRVGDVVISRRGDLSRAAAIRETEQGWICGTGCFMLRLGQSTMRPDFTAFVYRHDIVQRQIAGRAVGTTMPSLNNSVMARLVFPFVSPDEQAQIVERLESVDSHLSTLNHELNVQRQQKHGLMHDLLTGRVRVPVAAAAEGGSA